MTTPLKVRRGKLVLTLRGKYGVLGSDPLFNGLRQFARLVGREPVIET